MATNAEIFRVPEDYPLVDDDGAPLEPGWYFWYCMPGCLPDSDAFGPHASAADAERAAREDDDDDGPGPDVDAIRSALDDSEVTDEQIAALQGEAITACDWAQTAICRLALDGERYTEPGYLTAAESARLQAMTQDSARAECVRVIRAAHRARNEAWSAVDAIRSQAARLGMPRHFRTDLDHDQRAILARAGQGPDERSFGWAVYEHGTFLVWACGGSASQQEVWNGATPGHSFMRSVRDTFHLDTPVYFYLYTPTAGLQPMPDAETLDRNLAIIEDAAREAVL